MRPLRLSTLSELIACNCPTGRHLAPLKRPADFDSMVFLIHLLNPSVEIIFFGSHHLPTNGTEKYDLTRLLRTHHVAYENDELPPTSDMTRYT